MIQTVYLRPVSSILLTIAQIRPVLIERKKRSKNSTMVFKVSKGGVRTGNTLRGLHSTRTKRYSRHACILGSTTLGKRDMSRLINSDDTDDALVRETMNKTGVLLSLNKQQRWRLPAIVGRMIKDGEFNKKATVSMLEKHKLKRKANCVRLISNSAKSSDIIPKQKKYFSFSLDSIAHDESKRKRRRVRAEELKRMPKEKVLHTKKYFYKTIETHTTDGRKPTHSSGSITDSDKHEYRLEVIYPCPKSCSLTYNPKYTDVVVAEGKTGQMEVKANVKTPKKGLSTHRKRITSKDVDLLCCDAINDDVDEMWEEAYNEEIETEENSDTCDELEYHSMNHNIGMLLVQAEKTRDLLLRKKKSNGNKNKRQRRLTFSDNKQDKSHIFYMGGEVPVQNILQLQTADDKNENNTRNFESFDEYNVSGPIFSRVILSNCETLPEQLKEQYGSLYTESSCQPRRFVLDITDDVSNLLSHSKSSLLKFNYTSYLVFMYDGFYDDGWSSYKVAFNSMIENKMNGLSNVLPFAQQSISDVMNTLVSHLLDLKEENSLEFVEMNSIKPKGREFLNSRIKLTVDVFDPSQRTSRLPISGNEHKNECIHEDTQHLHNAFSDVDEDSFCDVCYTSVTSYKIDSVCATKLNTCGHLLCDDCWRSHFRTLMKAGKTTMSCAGYDCNTSVNLVTLMPILNMSEIALLVQRQTEERLESMENAKWCPYPECGRVIVVDSKWKDLCVDVICACGNQFCFSCFGPPHWPARCEQAEEYLEKLPIIKPAKEYVEEKSLPTPIPSTIDKKPPKPMTVEGRLCPKCSKFIEKHGGCPHMICKCGFSMCWTCMKHYHYNACKPDHYYVYSLTRVLLVRHHTRNQSINVESDQKQAPPKIQKNKQKASLYQRALQQREEVTQKRYNAIQTRPLMLKIQREAQQDLAFKSEIMKAMSMSSPEYDVSLQTIDVSEHIRNLLKSSVEMKQELHRVIEFTFILIQGTLLSMTKQRILKLTDDLGGFCSFVRSILDLEDKQDAKAAFRRLVDLQAWAKRALDALVQATSNLRKE